MKGYHRSDCDMLYCMNYFMAGSSWSQHSDDADTIAYMSNHYHEESWTQYDASSDHW